MGEDPRATAGLATEPVPGRPRERVVVALKEAIRMLVDPPVIDGEMVGHEVEDQPHAEPLEPLPQRREAGIAAQRWIDAVAAHRVRRAHHVLERHVGQGVAVLLAQPGKRARDVTGAGAALPHSHQPHAVEAVLRHPRQLGLGNVGEADRAPRTPTQRVQPDPGVDLVDRGVSPPAIHPRGMLSR